MKANHYYLWTLDSALKNVDVFTWLVSMSSVMRDAFRKALGHLESQTLDKRLARKAVYARDTLLAKIARSPGSVDAAQWRVEIDKLNTLIKANGLRP